MSASFLRIPLFASKLLLSCSVTLEKKGTLFAEDQFSGAGTDKKGKGCHWTTEMSVRLF